MNANIREHYMKIEFLCQCCNEKQIVILESKLNNILDLKLFEVSLSFFGYNIQKKLFQIEVFFNIPIQGYSLGLCTVDIDLRNETEFKTK